jgi:dUTP pyrophosphatase
MSDADVRILQLPHGADLPLPSYQSAHAAGLDLLAASEAALPVDVAVMAAAVSDWRVAVAAAQKM